MQTRAVYLSLRCDKKTKIKLHSIRCTVTAYRQTQYNSNIENASIMLNTCTMTQAEAEAVKETEIQATVRLWPTVFTDTQNAHTKVYLTRYNLYTCMRSQFAKHFYLSEPRLSLNLTVHFNVKRFVSCIPFENVCAFVLIWVMTCDSVVYTRWHDPHHIQPLR